MVAFCRISPVKQKFIELWMLTDSISKFSKKQGGISDLKYEKNKVLVAEFGWIIEGLSTV